jgi:hypothetical protein
MFDGNGEADADVASAARQNRGVHTHQFAAEIDERAAGVAGIDRRIGLNEVLVHIAAAGIDACAAECADDAGRHGVLKTERIADRYDEIANLRFAGVAQRNVHEIRRFDLEHCDVRGLVAADDFRLDRAVVEQRDVDFGRVFYDVRVRNDVTVFGVDDDAGAGRLRLALPRALLGNVEKASEERIVEKRIALRLHGAFHRDIDDGRRCPLDHRRQRGHRRFAYFGRKLRLRRRLRVRKRTELQQRRCGYDRGGHLQRKAKLSMYSHNEPLWWNDLLSMRPRHDAQPTANHRRLARARPLSGAASLFPPPNVRCEALGLRRGDFDATRLHRFLLRNGDRQYAIGGFCGNGFDVRCFRQRETTRKLSVCAFDSSIAVRFLRFARALAANGQYALVGRDFDGFRVNARDIDLQHIGLVGLADVHRGCPIGKFPIGVGLRPSEMIQVECPLEIALQLRGPARGACRLKVNQAHNCLQNFSKLIWLCYAFTVKNDVCVVAA